MIRRIYDWVLHWAETPYGTWALFFIAVSEASFFLIPPDVLLIALSVSIPKKALRFAFICTVGSIIGGCLGYLIGWQFMEGIGNRIIELYGFTQKIEYIADLYRQYDAWAIGIAGFTPIPYKLFTITAGAFKINFPVFIISSIISRAARFFLVGGLIYAFGPGINIFIDKYFNILVVVLTVLLISGFAILKLVM